MSCHGVLSNVQERIDRQTDVIDAQDRESTRSNYLWFVPINGRYMD